MPLEPIEPEEALELYLEDKLSELAQATLYSHKSRLGHFTRWCEIEEISNLNELTGRMLYRYRLWRREDGDLNSVSEKTQMDTFRVFIRWCEAIDAVLGDLSEKVIPPSLSKRENTRDAMVDAEAAEAISGNLRNIEFSEKKANVIETLVRAVREEQRGSPADHSVRSLQEAVDDDISELTIRDVVGSLVESDLVAVRESAGRGGADLYRWDGDESLHRVDDTRCALQAADDVYLLSVPEA